MDKQQELQKQEIKKLVKRFEDQKEQYKQGTYKEASVRLEFLDKFFAILGWDVGNNKNLSETQKEVDIEDTLEIKKKHGSADYSFRIGGTRQFFVEAKKPSVNIQSGDKEAYQTRRYGYSASLPLCILTDFEEFAIYDTRIKPIENDTAKIARYKYYTYKEYEQNIKEISELFSRDAVGEGSLENWKVKNKALKGSSPVDKEFLYLLEKWRESLAKTIATQNKDLNIHELNYVVQKIIDRIIFLRIAESREIETYKQLIRKDKSCLYYQHLQTICHTANKKYNSGLFQQEQIFDDLKVSDKALQPIIENLYYPKSPYEFSVFNAEILGKVYEQFLGNVIRLTAQHHAKVEQKPEVKKAGGIYYTPRFIVRYIVENTLGEAITNKSPEQIAYFKILDPACGSGSFLLGVYQYLLDYHLDYYQKKENKTKALKNGVLYEKGKNSYALAITEKQKILLNNIYGVDTDEQAVEVTKLSLFLQLMEGESRERVASLFAQHQTQALPDLAKNIQCGNSLVSSKFYQSQLSELAPEQTRKINCFDWELAFAKIIDAGGFDIVVGNPPYITLQKFKGEPLQQAMAEAGYRSHHAMGDIYCLFYEKGISLLKPAGKLGFITSNKWMRAGYGKNLRAFLSDHNPLQLLDLSKSKIFEGVSVDCNILIISKEKSKNKCYAYESSRNFNSSDQISKEFKKQRVKLINLNESQWIIANETELALKKKIEANGKPLKDWDINIKRGVLTGYNKAFIIDKAKRDELVAADSKNAEIIKPLLRGRDIKRYNIDFANLYLITTFPALKIKIDDYPTIKEYLLTHTKKRLDQSGNKGSRKKTNNKWFETQDQIAYYQDFKKEKIVWTPVNSEYRFSVVPSNYYFNNSIFMITGRNIKFFCACLNSIIVRKYLEFCLSKESDYTYGSKEIIEKTPIPSPSPEQEKKIVQLVDQMLLAQKNLQASRIPNEKTKNQRIIDALDQQINQLVCQLYQLTDTEISTLQSLSR